VKIIVSSLPSADLVPSKMTDCTRKPPPPSVFLKSESTQILERNWAGGVR